MIPNRLIKPLDPVEQMAEAGHGRLIDIARETGNRHLVQVLQAISREARIAAGEKRKRRSYEDRHLLNRKGVRWNPSL